ncbi:hypothetical protein H6P81_009836 [Aristolochia fimbriata]|uniref:RNA-binding protein 48 n=1 Tax=Aristolochia fimbriata TaxID=158543 RepID=A0AAV7EN44_ARIFI|nr:hypothetical protein H6P81_009836 [Aristolochia fimbriata]
MPRNKDELPAVRVYTVCDESRYLIVRDVPALGCGDELLELFKQYGEVEECKPMDAEDCAPFTDVYWIKFFKCSHARFAKRKLDESVFLGNRLQVSYAPQFETLSDTKEKLEGRRKEVLSRINPGRSRMGKPQTPELPLTGKQVPVLPPQQKSFKGKEYLESKQAEGIEKAIPISRVSSDKEYFSSPSMNETVRLVRERLDKIKSSGHQVGNEPALKKSRVDNRRRI